MDLIAEHA